MFADGQLLTFLEYLQGIFELANHYEVPVHIDGARLFNAQAETQVGFDEYGAMADSLSLSLCKGLSCPVGSVLVGSGSFIERARRVRKWLGGGMRQSGILAACGLVALDETLSFLVEDNARCRRLGSVTLGLEGVKLAQATIDTNILFLEVNHPHLDAPMIEAALSDYGILAIAMGDRLLRFVTHCGIVDADIDHAAQALQNILQEDV